MAHRTTIIPALAAAAALALPATASAVAPTAAFTAPATAETGTFSYFDAAASANAPADNGIIVRYEWDFDDDGFWDHTSTSPLWAVKFTADDADPSRDITLRVTDSEGETDTATETIAIGTRPVVSGVNMYGTWSGATGAWLGGTQIFFELGSVIDPDFGDSETIEWDLDGDGVYAEPAEIFPVNHLPRVELPEATTTVTGGVRVEDSYGLVGTKRWAIRVAAPAVTRSSDDRSAEPPATPAPAAPALAPAALTALRTPAPARTARATGAAAAKGISLRSAKVTRRGGSVVCEAAAGSRCSVQVYAGRKVAGAGIATVGASGAATVKLALNRKGRKALRAGAKVQLKATVTADGDRRALTATTRVR